VTSWRKFKKVELHRHLEGSVRLQTVLDVAREAGVKLPCESLEELREKALILQPMADLKTVLDRFWLIQSVLATPAIIERVAYENVVDAHHDGIRVLELRYSPGFIFANHPGLDYDMIHEAIVRGVTKAEKELSGAIAVGLICIISRDQPMKEADKTAAFAINHRKTFIGFDLAGSEAGFPCSLFKDHFKRARESGLQITAHAGEVRIKESPAFVKESIEVLGARRIGHGLQIIHDSKIVEFVRDRGVVLELCPTSNVITNAVGSLEEHPIRRLMKAGVRVTLNSDDPHIFGIDLTHEYEELASKLAFTPEEFDLLNQEALKASFIAPEKAAKAWNA
jgi:adenosine deaminase